MADERTIMWSGKSGQEYKYWIFPIIGTSFEPVAGNYIFARETKPHTWTPVYIGETENLQNRLTTNHEKMPCINRYGGTHVHTHTSSSSDTIRRQEEADIRSNWNPPCNQED